MSGNGTNIGIVEGRRSGMECDAMRATLQPPHRPARAKADGDMQACNTRSLAQLDHHHSSRQRFCLSLINGRPARATQIGWAISPL